MEVIIFAVLSVDQDYEYIEGVVCIDTFSTKDEAEKAAEDLRPSAFSHCNIFVVEIKPKEDK